MYILIANHSAICLPAREQTHENEAQYGFAVDSYPMKKDCMMALKAIPGSAADNSLSEAERLGAGIVPLKLQFERK